MSTYSASSKYISPFMLLGALLLFTGLATPVISHAQGPGDSCTTFKIDIDGDGQIDGSVRCV